MCFRWFLSLKKTFPDKIKTFLKFFPIISFLFPLLRPLMGLLSKESPQRYPPCNSSFGFFSIEYLLKRILFIKAYLTLYLSSLKTLLSIGALERVISIKNPFRGSSFNESPLKGSYLHRNPIKGFSPLECFKGFSLHRSPVKDLLPIGAL